MRYAWVSLLWVSALSAASLVAGEDYAQTFAGKDALQRFSVSGDVDVDAAKSSAEDGSGSLRVGPGAKAILELRPEDGSGKVEFMVYEDGAKPKNPKKRVSGAFWGVKQKDGKCLVPGPFYAPYLAGDTTYALSNYVPGAESPYGYIKYLGLKRKVGWHKWTFDFDADKGLTVSFDGKAIPAKRFDWNTSKQVGFNGLVFYGDASGAKGSLWIDDIKVTLAGAMKVGPKPPPPPAPVTPDKDPPLEGEPATMVPALKDVHPRVLFGPDDVERLKAFYASDAAKGFRKKLEGYLDVSRAPKKVKYIKDDTDAQRHGYWRMPTVGLHYMLTGDKASFDKCVGYIKQLLSLPHWQLGGEIDSGMGAANVMIGAGLLLDWLWNDLDPDLREAFRKKCMYHARAMYHGGHLMKAPSKAKYWQGDPANNHRWHRNAGLACCLFASYTGAPEEQWIFTKFRKEMDFIVKWLPPDGTSHESPSYMIFGLSHLVVAAQASDRCFGTDYLKQPFFKNVPRFVCETITPDTKSKFNYGDMGGIGVGQLGYDLSLYKCTSVHGLKAEQAMLDHIRKEHGAMWGWMGLLWYDPAQAGGNYKDLKTSEFFDDVGVLFARDGWKDDGVGVMFKNGPFGGFTLNRYRNENNYKYINVAHDDPNANSFILYARGKYLAETDRYSKKKKSANHNTILINGFGQMVPGRPAVQGWWQPAQGKVDMTKLGMISALKLTDKVDMIAGEASRYYFKAKDKKSSRSRPGLDRYRRALTFVKGDYVLVLDDIRAPEPVDVSWLMQGPDLKPVDEKALRYKLINKDEACEFQVQTNHNDALACKIVDSPADGKKKVCGWRQLRVESKTQQIFLASVYDLYKKKLAVTLDAADLAKVKVQVKGDGIDDAWEWVPAAKWDGTYTLTGRRGDTALIQVTAEDRPPDPMAAHE